MLRVFPFPLLYFNQAGIRGHTGDILGKHAGPGVEKGVAALTAQAKYLSTRLAHKVAYEIQQLMGGISVTDNTHMDQIAKISDLQEVIAGHRNVMLLLIQNQMRKQSQLIKI